MLRTWLPANLVAPGAGTALLRSVVGAGEMAPANRRVRGSNSIRQANLARFS